MFPDFSVEIEDVREVGGLMLVKGANIRGHRDGEPRRATDMATRRARCGRKDPLVATFPTRSEALEAAGLSE